MTPLRHDAFAGLRGKFLHHALLGRRTALRAFLTIDLGSVGASFMTPCLVAAPFSGRHE